MQTQINQEQGPDEFQQAQDEVLTYVLSQQIGTSPFSKQPKRLHPKIDQRHKLQLVKLEREPVQFNFNQLNKNIKRSSQHHGRVIRIGNVTFKSNFQCGNLNSVRLTAFNTYQIELEKQSNSNRVSGWFYFSVEGIKGEAHFIIRGFTKSSSLYNQGMKVCFRDMKELTKWRRGGTRITYTNTEDQDQQTKGYQLRYSHFFKNNQITCIEFAYCFPYGLKKLTNLISLAKSMAEVKVLGRTFDGQNMPLLIIGNKKSDKVIVLSARVHPGETVSSFIMQGFIKELVGDNQYGKLLRSQFLFKIVPMLNPDGVTKGNYRFSGYGCDLNRKWKTCKQHSQPQIFFMKNLIRQTNKEKKVIMYIDIHGHSRKKNVFFYGCVEKGSQNPKPKEFPYIMEKIHDAYKYQNCCFAMPKGKEGTARITVWKQLKIDYVYTLQSSFCGSEYGPNYLEADLQKLGKKLCEGVTCLFYQQIEASKSGQAHRIMQKLATLKKKAVEQLYQNPKLLQVGDVDDSGSQSQPQIGQIAQKQRNPQTGVPKPQSFTKDHREERKSRKIKITTKAQSQHNIKEASMTKLKSQPFVQEQISKKIVDLNPIINTKHQGFIVVQEQRPRQDRAQIKIASSVNTFQLQTLRASSLYQKNVRVHSITRNNFDSHQSQRSKKVVNPFSQVCTPQRDKQSKVRINLIHGREGAQYRRVRKIAEDNMKKEMVFVENTKVVKQLHAKNLTHNIQIDSHAIAPRFYPVSQQRPRKVSLQTYIRRQPKVDQLRKISINGDELNVRCFRKHVFL